MKSEPRFVGFFPGSRQEFLANPTCLWPEGSPSQGCDTRSLDTGSLTKGKSLQSLLVLLAESRLLKTALELKGTVVWKLKSHQIFHWKTEGAASPSVRQRRCSWSAGQSESQGAGQACLAEQDSLLWMLLKLATVGETLPLTAASGRGDRCGAGEMTGKKSTARDRRGKGLLCSQSSACPIPREKAPSVRPICQPLTCLSTL